MKKTFKKRAFISAIAMLIVSAIVLTSATYAWFSMSKQVEVDAMNLNITSPDGIQISANTTNFTTHITMDELMGGTLNPDGVTRTATRYSADEGNTNHFPDVISPSSSSLRVTNSLPIFYVGAIGDDQRASATRVASDADGKYVVFDMFIKVAKAQKVYWGTSTLTCADNADVPSAMRIGVVNCGFNAGSNADEKTAVKSVLPANSTGNRVVIYEPLANQHTEASNTADGTYVQTKYVMAAYSGVTPTNGNYVVNSGYTETTPGIEAKSTDTANQNTWFNAGAGINRIRVYLWMEGNDVDCANDVAGAAFDFNLVLTID